MHKVVDRTLRASCYRMCSPKNELPSGYGSSFDKSPTNFCTYSNWEYTRPQIAKGPVTRVV